MRTWHEVMDEIRRIRLETGHQPDAIYVGLSEYIDICESMSELMALAEITNPMIGGVPIRIVDAQGKMQPS